MLQSVKKYLLVTYPVSNALFPSLDPNKIHNFWRIKMSPRSQKEVVTEFVMQKYKTNNPTYSNLKHHTYTISHFCV